MNANITRWLLATLVLTAVTVYSTAVYAAGWCNQGYQNTTGQTAYGLIKILWGFPNVTDVYSTAPFADEEVIQIPPPLFGGLTIIYWHNGQVPPGGKCSACFKKSDDQQWGVVCVYWTDADGTVIDMAAPVASIDLACPMDDDIALRVCHQGHHWSGSGIPIQDGDGPGAPFGQIVGTNVAYTVQDTALPAWALTDSLWGPHSAMEWIPLSDFVLSEGDSVTYNGGSHGPGDVILFRFELEGEGLTSYEIVQREASTSIPTLTEWGLIIFGVMLLGFITWVFLRRKKVAVRLQ